MIKREYTITSKNGFHAKPVIDVVTVAEKYKSIIMIKDLKNNHKCDLKSIMGVMALGMHYSNDFEISIDGIDEDIAFDDIDKTLLQSNLVVRK